MSYKALIESQRTFFKSNITKDVSFRLQQLKKLLSVIDENEQLLYKSIYEDFKKSEFDTWTTEISLVRNEIKTAIKSLPKWTKKQKVKTNLPNVPGTSYRIPEPLGVCLVIGAANYPYQLAFLPIIAAMAAGNTVILKPSETSAKSSDAMAQMINNAFEEDYVKVVEGGVEATTALLEEKFDHIFFTGSTRVGKIIYQAAAKHLTPVTLELGGKSPVIVTKDADIQNSAKRIVWGKFLNAGQTCIAPDYILVDAAVEEKLLSAMKQFVEKFDYSFENNNYCQILSEQSCQRLIGLIDKEKVFVGGRNELKERWIEPTILRNVTFDDKIMADEVFGPILPVLTYTNLEDAIAEVKERPKPLACYIFTNSSRLKQKVFNELSFGGGQTNDTLIHSTNSNLPFGGVGDSGMGSYHGKAGFETFSHYKSILDRPFLLEPDFKYPPYSSKKLFWIKKIVNLNM